MTVVNQVMVRGKEFKVEEIRNIGLIASVEGKRYTLTAVDELYGGETVYRMGVFFGGNTKYVGLPKLPGTRLYKRNNYYRFTSTDLPEMAMIKFISQHDDTIHDAIYR